MTFPFALPNQYLQMDWWTFNTLATGLQAQFTWRKSDERIAGLGIKDDRTYSRKQS
jgi:hypothetical protein